VFSKILARNPQLANFIQQLDSIAIINECATNALQTLADALGVKVSDTVRGMGGKMSDYEGTKILGAIATKQLPYGLGVIVNPDGSIGFVADDWGSGAKDEIKRLQGIYEQIYTGEATKAVMEIFGYQIKISNCQLSANQNEVTYTLQGVKQ
jgi:hypothetical protein